MITIDKVKDSIEINFGEDTTCGEAFSFLMQALEAVVQEIVKDVEDITDKEAVFDAVDFRFNVFLRRVFPDIDPHEFDLTDAAVVKAQDEIINDAYERGITFEQALKEYEDKAKEYIDARKMS